MQGEDTIIKMGAFEDPRFFRSTLSPDECCKWTLIWIAFTAAMQIAIILIVLFLKPWFEDMHEKIGFLM